MDFKIKDFEAENADALNELALEAFSEFKDSYSTWGGR